MTDEELFDSVMTTQEKASLSKSAIIAHNTDPDRYAANVKAAKQQGWPVAIATPATNPVNGQKLDVLTASLHKKAGTKVAQFSTDPYNLKMAHDDLDNLSAWEDFFKPTLKAIPRVLTHTAASMAQMPISGLSAAGKFVTTAIKTKGDFDSALMESNKILEENQRILDETYLTTPEERKGSENIGLAMKPFQMAGRGWAGMAELPTGGLEGAVDVVKGRSAGSNIGVPIMGTIGEASAMFGLGEALKVAKARGEIIKKALDTTKKVKVRKREPEVAIKFFKSASENAEPVKMPVETVDNILADTNKTLDDAFESPERYYEAKFRDDLVEVPVSDLAMMADDIKPEHINEMKVGDSLSVKEVEAKIEEAKALDTQSGETQVTDPISTPSPDAKVQPQGEFGIRWGKDATDASSGESRLAQRAEADAIEAKLSEGFGDLAQYQKMSMKDQAEKAQTLLDADYEAAKRMAMGEELPPGDVREATMYEAVKLRAIKEGDVDTLYRLATESTVPTRLSEYGQAIKAADSRQMFDPVFDAQEIAKERAATAAKTGKTPESTAKIDELTAKLKEAEEKLAAYQEAAANKQAEKVVKEIVKREAKKTARVATKQALDTEFKDLTKQLNSILNPNRTNIGVPVDAFPVLAKMVENRIKSGLVSVEAIVDSIYNQVKDMMVVNKKELRDAISASLQDIQAKQDASKLKGAKSRLKSETSKLENRLAEGDFEKVARKSIELDAEGKKLKAQRDAAKENYRAAMEAGGSVSKEEIAQLVELSRITQEARAAMESGGDRIAYGAARVAYEGYVADLKGINAPVATLLKNRAAEFKTTWGENKARAVTQAAMDTISAITNNSIALVATLDNSFLGRQGLKTLMTHPSAWWPGAKQSFVDFAKTIGGKNMQDALLADVYSRPNFLNGEYQRAKILTKMEEQYPATLPERIPGVGRVFKASEVAFTGSALRMRTSLYDLLAKRAKENGVDMLKKENAESLGKLINSLTARGQWGKRGEGTVVRLVLWAPKMLKANIDVLTAHNFGAGLESAFARKQAALNIVKIVGETATLMMIADAMMPGSVEYDPRSTDFGKIKINDTRFDITGGAASIVTLASRIASRASKSTQTGLVTEYGLGYGKSSPFDALVDFLMNKTSPPARVVVDWLKGETREGEPFTAKGAAFQTFTPISIQNAIKAKDEASAEKVAAVLLDLIGVNANSYTDDNLKKRDIINRLRKGKDLTAEQQEMFEGFTDSERKDIEKKSEMTSMQEAFSNLPADSMVYTWSKLTDAERDELREIYDAKINKYILDRELEGEELNNFLENIDKAEQRKWGVK